MQLISALQAVSTLGHRPVPTMLHGRRGMCLLWLGPAKKETSSLRRAVYSSVLWLKPSAWWSGLPKALLFSNKGTMCMWKKIKFYLIKTKFFSSIFFSNSYLNKRQRHFSQLYYMILIYMRAKRFSDNFCTNSKFKGEKASH